MPNNRNPLVSIITVVYNGADTIEQTINSVINQSYNKIEYIIIDGGSSDGTLDIIHQHEEHIDDWISEPDEGLYDAMNKGIAKARGELIGMINSDDWYEPSAVALIVDTYKSHPYKRIFHGDRFDVHLDGTRRLYKFNSSKFKLFYSAMTYNHPSMFVHRDIYRKCKYNTSFESYADYEFALKQYLKDPDIFEYIPIAYVNYRLDGISAKQSFKENIKEGVKARFSAGLKLYHVIGFSIIKSIKTLLRSILKRRHYNQKKD